MNKIKINNLFLRLSKEFILPQSELKYKINFTFLVAVILSAQSTDISVNKATKKLFNKINSPKDIVRLGETKLKTYIKTIGLYNSKAKNILLMSKILINDYNSIVPKDFDELIKLPGVGNKTASVYQNVILKKPRIAVDTHVYRVSNRTGLVSEKTTDKTQAKLEKIVPKKWRIFAHHLLILHGRYICKSQKPLCKKCSISSICQFKGKLI